MKKKKEVTELVKKLGGLQTLESVMKILKIKKRTAINYISKLRKRGYVEYFSAGRKKRIYRIGIKPAFSNRSIYDIINNYSRIKVKEPYKKVVHRKITNEEAIVLAIKEQNFRLILASVSLFNHIKNWKLLNKFAKIHKVQRQVGALYDLARIFIRTRRMDKRTRRSMLKCKGNRYIYDKIKTKEFFDIAKRWDVEIPFKKADLDRLKTG